jgi:hypothetical protein
MISYFPLLLNVLYPDLSPVQLGLRGLGFGAGVTIGASAVSLLISHTRGHVRELFLISCTTMST